MCRVDRTRWDGFAQGRYDFDFRILRRGLRGYLWAFPCLIDGVPHANIGAYAVTPSGTALDDAMSDYLGELGGGTPRRVAFPIHWYQPRRAYRRRRRLVGRRCGGRRSADGEGISLAMEYGDLAAAAIIDAVRRR